MRYRTEKFHKNLVKAHILREPNISAGNCPVLLKATLGYSDLRQEGHWGQAVKAAVVKQMP